MSGVIVVTGGSRGIGRATVLLAAERGYDICFSYIANEAAAAEVVKAVEAEGRKVAAVKGDVGSEADVLALFEAADRLGPLRGLVNNAGVVLPVMRVEDMSAERLQRMMTINIVGSFLCAREAIKRLSTRHGGKGGAIVNLSSIASELGGPGAFVDYAASKGAIDTFTLGLGREVAAEGIRVNAVSPGLIETDIHASAGVGDRLVQLRDGVPMKRIGTADEVAKAILWLLSEEASYSTGAIVTITGGR